MAKRVAISMPWRQLVILTRHVMLLVCVRRIYVYIYKDIYNINNGHTQQYADNSRTVLLDDLPGASKRTSSGLAMGIFFFSAFSRILRIMGPIMYSRVVVDVDDDTDNNFDGS